MNKKIINTELAPEAIGPYSQSVLAGNILFISGQLPINPETGKFAGNNIKSQTEQSLKNIESILEKAGCTMDNVVKTTVLLNDMGDFAKMNEVYAKFFTKDYPARAAYEVAKLPKDALVEIEAVAVVD